MKTLSSTQSFVLVLLLTLTSCSTMSNRSKILTSIAVSGGAGAIAGAISAPHDEKKIGHAALWGGLSATVISILGLYLFNEQAVSEECSRENDHLKKQIHMLHDDSVESGETLLFQSSKAFGRELPNEYRNLVKPGEWSIYKIDQWINQGENTLIHQDKLIKISPPHLNPNTSEEKK